MKPPKIIAPLLYALALFVTLMSSGMADMREIRVGVYSNEPKIFVDKNGEATGIFPDLLREIAAKEKWNLKFVPCEWQHCLEMVESGDLDLMPDVAQTEARLARFDFHKTPGLNSWSVIYRNPSIKIQSFLDLENKSIAVLKDSVQQSYLRNALNGFGVNARLIPIDSFEEGFKRVESGQIDAVAANHHYGTYASKRFHLAETPIIFLPSSLFFATKKGSNADLLTTLDYYFNQWREDPHSPFFRILKKWTGEATIAVVPQYIWWALGVIAFAVLFMTGIAAYLRKIVKKRTAEIQESENKLNSILSDVGSSIYIKDNTLRYQYANRATCESLGRKESDIIGKLDSDLYDTHEAAQIMQTDRNVIESGHRYTGEEVIRRLANEPPRTFFSVKIPLINALGKIYGICGISTDITDQLEFTKKLDRLAHFDPLTGLLNRSFFFEEVERLLKNPDRPIGQAAILLINLDNFRDLNDTQGHQVGDLLLIKIADQFNEIRNSHHLLSRIVGDSFAFLITTLPNGHSAIHREINGMIQQIQAAVARPKNLDGYAYHCSASIGVAIFDPLMLSAQDGFKQAELALYQAKNLERGSARIFEPQMQEVAATRLKLESELRIAIDNGQLEVYYQPQVDTRGTLLSFEALIRWNHPQHGLYSPASFIPLAESNGQILAIGQFVLISACKQLERWSKQPESSKIILAVNVSAREFFDEGFVDKVIQSLSRFSFNPTRLELELTESQFITNFDQALVKIAALKGMGLRLSIDDFGTGYSSLSRLKKLPFDQLKIDASFVRDLVTNPSDAAIVKTIVELGKSLRVEVLAEGVETQAQMDALIALGCEKFQGYLQGKPMPISQVETQYPALRSRED